MALAMASGHGSTNHMVRADSIMERDLKQGEAHMAFLLNLTHRNLLQMLHTLSNSALCNATSFHKFTIRHFYVGSRTNFKEHKQSFEHLFCIALVVASMSTFTPRLHLPKCLPNVQQTLTPHPTSRVCRYSSVCGFPRRQQPRTTPRPRPPERIYSQEFQATRPQSL
jgi:hypothetical protein